MQYDINRKAAKISALSSGKIDKHEYLTGEDIIPHHCSRITEKAKLTYSPLGKPLEKQIKAIEDQGEKQIKTIKDNRKQLDNTNAYLNNTNAFAFKEIRNIEEYLQ